MVGTQFHQNDVVAYLKHAAPWDKNIIRRKCFEKFFIGRKDYAQNLSRAIKPHIYDPAELFAVCDVDDFFFT